MKIAYFDASSGISGDMTVGALLDAGSPTLTLARLREALGALALDGYTLGLERVNVGGVGAASFQVRVADSGHRHGAGHAHAHPHHHPHRDWRSIRAMIEAAGKRGLSRGAVERSIAIFSVLAQAEGTVHGVAPEDVHFHEVGAVDSIVDIVAAAWCLDELGIDACFAGPLPSGTGWVNSEHGRLPVPAPATVELLRGFEIIAGDGEGELVTPTGAAILRALALPLRPAFRLSAVGVGAGMRRLADRPNVLRVLVGERDDDSDEEVLVLESDIDDMTPAALAHLAERLRADGARDVSVVPTIGKKSRSSMRLSVICDIDDGRRMSRRILAESSTIGLRYRTCGRIVLARRIDVVDTEFGSIACKVVVRPDGNESAEPELDDLARAAIGHDKPLREVRAAALSAWESGSKKRG